MPISKILLDGCDGFAGWCQTITVPDNIYLSGALLFLGGVMVVRVIRWILDVLP
jgi:hypothetical protein